MIAIAIFFGAGLLALLIPARRLPSAGAILAIGCALVVLCGLAGGLASSLTLGRLLAAVLALGGTLAAAWRFGRLPRRGRVVAPYFREPISLLLVVLVASGVYMLWRGARTPILSYDVLSYHIPLARAFAESDGGGAVLRTPGIFYARMPLGIPILEAPFVTPQYGNGFGTGLHLLIGIAILACASCAWRVTALLGGRRRTRILAAVFVIWHPMLADPFLGALADPLVALMALAGLELLLLARMRSGVTAQAALAGIVAGTAFAMKFSAVGVVLIPLGIVAAAPLLLGMNRRTWLVPVVYTVAAIAIMSPWLLRAQSIGGHPLYPFGGQSPDWTAEQAAFVVQAHKPVSPIEGLYWTDFLSKSQLFGFTLVQPPLSLLLILALGGLLCGRHRRIAPLLVAVGAGYLFFLTVRDNPARFLAPAVMLIVPAAALGAAQTTIGPVASRLLLPMVLLVWFSTVYTRTVQWFQFEGSYNPEERIAMLDLLGPEYMQVVRNANDATKGEGRLLLLFEARGALFPAKTGWHTVWDQPPWADALRSAETPDDFRRSLAAMGFTGILVNEFEWSRFLLFYARDKFPELNPAPRELSSRSMIGSIGLQSPPDLRRRALAEFPPHRFAGFTERQLTILADFLLSQWQNRASFTPAGSVSYIWYAPLPKDDSPAHDS